MTAPTPTGAPTERWASTSCSTGVDDEDQHIDAWRRIFDRHARSAALTGDLSNVWISSYTGEPIPAAEMDEWLDATSDLILRCRPRRVLDIGCGTGLVMSRVAPASERYVGVDVSPQTVDILRRRIADEGIPAEVHLARADDLSVLAGQGFDTIVLNSVVQYFPSTAHLVSVLREVSGLAEQAATIIIGDVRNSALMEAFHLDVALARSSPDDRMRGVLDRAARARRTDPELVLHPREIVEAVALVAPQATVHIALKRGRYENELSRFRYDAVVTLDSAEELGAMRIDLTLDWGRDVHSIADAVAAFDGLRGGIVRGVPNRRTGWTAFADVPLEPTTREFMELQEQRAAAAVDPEVLCRAFEHSGFEARPSWHPGAPCEVFDVIVQHGEEQRSP